MKAEKVISAAKVALSLLAAKVAPSLLAAEVAVNLTHLIAEAETEKEENTTYMCDCHI